MMVVGRKDFGKRKRVKLQGKVVGKKEKEGRRELLGGR